MEQNFLQDTHKRMIKSKINAKQYSPLVLAYMGDAVFEVFIRTKIVGQANAPVNKLHKASREYVKASAQAKIARALEGYLTEEEMAVFKRGRNAKSASVPKNADLMDYKNATGLEALVGYLYLDQQMERLDQIMELGISAMDQQDKK